ncbi:MAG: hypothetical protein HQ488_00580 [Parcubacteria group bacterium]|nr:hypothetical protein [Parcubacteria group bacterium]
MKTRTHHLLAIGIAVVVVALLVILPRGSQPNSTTQTSSLDGTWYIQWVGNEGEIVWMQYDILTPNYTVTASHGYLEEGTYVLIKGAIDRSMVIEKTWTNALGEQTYELTIVPNEDFTTITFDGVTLTKIEK